MQYSKEWYEEAARVEKQHVRAVILKIEEALGIEEASLPADSLEVEDTRRRLEVIRRRAGL